MVEEVKKTKVENKEKIEKEIVETKQSNTEEIVETDKKTEPKVEKTKKEKIAKELAEVRGYSLHISTKNSGAIGKMIYRKPLERAIEMLELVIKKKMAVPMGSREVPHKKRSLIPGPVGGGARFPINASKEILHLLKQLKANCEVNGVENPMITLFVANIGSRPFRRDRTRGKRTHIYIEARDKTKLMVRKK